MINHKHYTFNVVDSIKRESLPKGFALDMFLKAKMNYYIAQNKLQGEMKGDEQGYINMLSEEYSPNGISPS